MDSSRLVVMGDLIAILDSNIDRRWGANGSSDNRSLVNQIENFSLVNRYRVEHRFDLGLEATASHPFYHCPPQRLSGTM